MHVKTAFLHGHLEETIDMNQPPGFEDKTNPKAVCWFHDFIISVDFICSKYDPCLYFCDMNTEKSVLLLLYVDDMLIVSKNISVLSNIKSKLSKEFAMKDLGEIKRILGIDILHDKNKNQIFLSQASYVKKIFETI